MIRGTEDVPVRSELEARDREERMRQERRPWWRRGERLPTRTALTIYGGAFLFLAGVADPARISLFTLLVGLALVVGGILTAPTSSIRAEAIRQAIVYLGAFLFVGLFLNRQGLPFWQRLPITLIVLLVLYALVYWVSSRIESGNASR